MNTSANGNISFKTNIVFLSPGGMKSVVNKMRNSNNYMQIDDWYVRPPRGIEKLKGYRKNCSLGYTYGIRSCCSGVSVKKGGNAPYFWHIGDIQENLINLKDIRDITKCDNVILLGSKSKYYYSPKLFKRFENFIKKDKVPATIMKTLALGWQAFAAYVAENDTLYLCVQEMFRNIPKRVNSMKRLNKVFEKVRISPTDNLKFPNFIQEFLMINRLKIK